MKKIFNDWKASIVFGILILLLGFGLRLYNLTLLPIFADEAIYIRWSQVMQAEPGLRFLPLSDGKQPLFMWSLMFFVRKFTDPLFIGRLVSVVSGLGTIVGLFFLTFYLFRSRKVALLSGFVWAISPFSLFFDRMALVDSMLAMFGVWTLFLGIVTATTKRFDFAMLTGFALGGALLTKSPGIFFVMLLPTTWVFANWSKLVLKKGVGKIVFNLAKLASLLAVTYAIGFGMYNILRLGDNFHLIGARNQDYIFAINHLWQDPLSPLVSNLKRVFSWFNLFGPGILLGLALLGVILNLKRYPKELFILLVWFLFPILIQSEYARVFTARYILFSVPPVAVLASTVLLEKKVLIKKVLIFGIVIFALQSLLINNKLLTKPAMADLPRQERSGYLEEWTAGTGIYQVAQFVKNEHRSEPQKQIVIGTEGYFGTLPDGLQIYLEGIPNIVVRGEGLDLKKVPSSLVESKQAGNKTYLLINNSRFKGDADELGLKLIAAYPKALREKESREFNLHGPQEVLLFFEITEESIL